MNYGYFTATLDAAVWGAELAAAEGRGRIYLFEPTGDFEDDTNVGPIVTKAGRARSGMAPPSGRPPARLAGLPDDQPAEHR